MDVGMRAGAGSDNVQAYAVGFSGTAVFTATSTMGVSGKIVVDSGNNQTGVLGKSLPKPLIAVVVDSGNNRLPNVPVTFTVMQGGGNFAGQTSVTVTTDANGSAGATLTLGYQEGNSNNLIKADFPGDTGFAASFTTSGLAEGPAANTSISGVVLNNSNVPIRGVTIRALLTNVLNSNSSSVNAAATVQTNTQGQFTIAQAPVGFVQLFVDGSTATTAGNYPSLSYDIVTIAGQNNTVGMPIYLLPLSSANQLCVTGTTGGGTLTIPEAPGFSLTFGPGQVTFPGGTQTGCVSVTVVHPDRVPMQPGFGQQPRFIVTIQPSGALFNPPAPITLPNVDGLAARAVTEMYSFDHDIGSFVAIGTGTVSDDGQVIRSSQGVGVLKAGWHCGGDPTASGTVADCPPCLYCQGAQGLPASCVPDPDQMGKACTGALNNCIVPGTGTCGGTGCVGGQNQPVGYACNAGGTQLAQCDANGQCEGTGSECPTDCQTNMGQCYTAACRNSYCQTPVPTMGGTLCDAGGSSFGACDGTGNCGGSGTQCPTSCATSNVCLVPSCTNGTCGLPTNAIAGAPCGSGSCDGNGQCCPQANCGPIVPVIPTVENVGPPTDCAAADFGATDIATAPQPIESACSSGQCSWSFRVLGPYSTPALSGLCPTSHIDIPSPTDPRVTAATYCPIVTDLMPDATGRPTRINYWSSPITLIHETFHVTDWQSYLQAYWPTYQTTVEATSLPISQATDSSTAIALERQSFDQAFNSAVMQAYTTFKPGAEDRAYLNGKPLYQGLVKDICATARTKGWALCGLCPP